MNAFELLLQIADENVLSRLENGFAGMLETARQTEVIEWDDEFAVADKNPEVYFQLEQLEKDFKEGRIDEETFKREFARIARVPTSVTLGIAFIPEKKVSFRTMPPSLSVFLHELGHVHFRAGDLLWSRSYGGAEILLHLHVAGSYESSEEKVRDALDILDMALHDPESAHAVLLERLKRFIQQNNIYPHIGAVLLFAGVLVDEENAPFSPSDPAWEKIPITTRLMEYAITEILAGLTTGEPFCEYFARKMGWIE